MIEATCSACGTHNRIAEADVPVGAKFVNCTSCKSRIPLAAKAPAVPGPAPTPPTAPTAPTKATPKPIDLADLPAPKRLSPLGAEASKPAPKSALSAALDIELPAPKPKSPLGPLPAPPPGAASIELDDLLSGPDPELAPSGVSDLPAPKAKGIPSLTSPKPNPAVPPAAPPAGPPPIGLVDLPAPKAKPMPSVMPPKPNPAVPPAAPPAGPPPIGLVDLPAPKPAIKPPPGYKPPTPVAPPAAETKGPAGIIDLPTPKGPSGIVDLPTPKGPSGIVDLPTPKGITDLPAPKGPGGIVDLPTPKLGGVTDLPTPKAGGATDLLTPKHGGPDLPAPKGFFDDLPQPASSAAQTRGAPDLPAPKGFFDDLPQPAPGTKSGARSPNDIAPKGFFEDLPQRAPDKGTEVTPSTRGANSEGIAPKGFFDDLPQPKHDGGLSLDGGGDLELGPPDASAPLDLDDGGPQLDLGEPLPPAAPATPAARVKAPSVSPSGGAFDDLDLSAPTASPVRFDTPSKRAPTAGGVEQGPLPPMRMPRGASAADETLELEEPRPTDPGPSQKLGPRKEKKDQPVVDPVAARRSKEKVRKILAGAVLGLAVLGGGGFVMYKRHAAAQERRDEVAQLVSATRKSMAADDLGHWQRAARSAQKALEVDDKNPEALGLAAEATIASVMADGQGGVPKIRKAGKIISDALGEGITSPELKRAQALLSVTTIPEKAPSNIEALLAQAPKDGVLALYLGWANAAKGDPAAAVKAFDQALANAPSVKLEALHGRGRAKLALGDLEGARADFKAALDVSKDYVPAMVGLAAAQPLSASQQQEADLLAITQRKDFETADPRAIVQTWSLAAEDAARSGRLDVARERFRKALAVDDKSMAALTGLAEVELRDTKLDTAADLITTALTQSADNVRAQLIASEISIAQGKLDDAEARIKILTDRAATLVPLDGAQLMLVTGMLLDKQNKPDAAVDAYIAGAKLAGDLDLRPTMAAVTKLTAMAKAETDPKRAAALKERADLLLGTLADKAKEDPQLAMTLGRAYLQVGDAAKAEPWLRRVVDTRPNDPDAIYQLGLAVAKLDRSAEAIELLQKASALTPERTEIGLALARTYDASKRDDDAEQLYGKLLEHADPSIELRGHAGRFYARHGRMDKAFEQGQKIVAVDRASAVGHYLEGEGFLAQDKFDEARKQMIEATSGERDPAYLDGLGRATEKLAAQRNNDLQLLDAALHAYMDAVAIDPTIFTSQLGQGRVYIARGEFAKAIEPLQAAWKIKEDAEVAYLIGIASKQIDQKPAAAVWLKKSVSMTPNANASLELGRVYVDLNDARGAQAAFSTATRMAIEEEKQGKNIEWLTEALFSLGDVSYKLHDEPSARAAWEKYVARNPRQSAALEEVKRHLLTDLR